jgi:hypothetical protein
VVLIRAATEKEAADAVAVKKATNDTVAVKKATDEAMVVKMAVDDTTTVKKAADNAVVVKKAANEVATAKEAIEDATTVKKAADDAVTAGSSSSSAPSGRAKRVINPSGSTPPAKRQFLGSWKPRYIAQTFICHFLYYSCDFDLVLLAYSMSSSGRSPLLGGWGTTLWVHPKPADPRTPLRLTVPRGRLLGLLVTTGS